MNRTLKPRCNNSLELDLWIARLIAGHRILPAEAVFYLTVIPIVMEAEERFSRSPELRENLDRSNEILAEYLIEDEGWGVDDGPPEYRALSKEHDEIYARFVEAALREFGEVERADLYRDNRAEYDRIYTAGREFFYGPPIPAAARAKASDLDDED